MRLLVGMPHANSLGGPAACEPPFVRALRERFDIEVEEEVYVYGDRLTGTSFSERVARVLRTAHALRRRLRAGRFDLIHLNTAFDTKTVLRDFITLETLGSYAGKVFLKMHGSDAQLLETKNHALRFMYRRSLARVRGIGVLSSEEKKNFLRAGISEAKIFVVKNAVAKNLYSRALSSDTCAKASEQTPALLFIARFIETKGLLDVIRACAMVRDRGFAFELRCLGDGPVRAAAEAEVEQLNLQSEVRFFGYVPEAETAEFYQTSRMLVLPTFHPEGFPMTIFNAVAAGTPVITTRIRAAADYLHEPENCLWTEAKNPSMLAEKIIKLLEHPELCEMMSRNNRKLAEQFRAEKVAEEYVEIYRRVLQAV